MDRAFSVNILVAPTMSHELSPEAEAYLCQLVAAQVFPDRAAALEEAVRALRQRQGLRSALDRGLEQLEAGNSVAYGPDEFERFRADVHAARD